MSKIKFNIKKIFKKLVKFFLWFTAIFLCVIIAAYIFIRIKFPPEEIKKIIETQVSSALNNRAVHIEKVSLNPLKGFSLTNLAIYEIANSETVLPDSDKVFSLREVSLKYKLSSLLSRTLKIKEIGIDQPQIFLTINSAGKSNIEQLIPPTTSEPEREQDTTKTELNLPIALELDKFNLSDFNAFIQIETENTTIHSAIGNLSIRIMDLVIPKGSLETIKKDARAAFTLKSPGSPWKVYVESQQLQYPIEVNSQFDMSLDVDIAGLADIKLTGNAGWGHLTVKEFDGSQKVTPMPVSQLLNLILNLHINGDDEKIAVNELTAQLADENALKLTGTISNIFSQPEVSLSVDDSRIQLANLFNALKTAVPSDFQNLIEGANLQGTLSLQGTQFRGNPLSDTAENGLAVTANLDLSDVTAYYPNPKITIHDLDFNLNASGQIFAKGMEKGVLHSSVILREALIAPDDTLNFLIKNLSTNLSAELSEDYFPSHIQLTSVIEDIFSAAVDVNLDFESYDKFHKYLADATINVSGLDVENVPFSPAAGYVKSNISIHSTSLQDVTTKLSIATDSLFLSMEENELVIAPTVFDGIIKIATDQNFQDFDIQQIEFNVNDFLVAKGKASVANLGAENFQATFDSILVYHNNLFHYLPKSLKTGLDNLELDGRSLFALNVGGKIPEKGDPVFQATVDGDLFANINYPDIPVTIDSFYTKLNAETDGMRADASVIVDIKNILLSELREQPLKNTSLTFSCQLPDFNRVQIDTSRIKIPSLNSNAVFGGEINELASVPNIRFELAYRFASPDSTLIVNDLFVTGNLAALFNFQYKLPLITVSGEMRLDKLNAFFADQIAVQDITGRIPFTQRVTMDDLIKFNTDTHVPVLADVGSIDYLMLRPYYVQLAPAFSHLEIRNVTVQDYQLSDLIMDINLGNGKFEVPLFSMNLYDGNVAGNMSADFRQLQVNAATSQMNLDAVNYSFKANVSQLNSAKLLPKHRGSEEDSELNLNLEFRGSGLDPQKEIDVNGYLYITKIGSKFTDNVLNSLDPKGTDKSIQDTKRLLHWGYKPRLISFEVKHGNMYPSIHLMKGNFITKLIPLNLSGGKIELARMPLQFFLRNQLAATK